MANELRQSLRDAIALTTLLDDAKGSGAEWNEPLLFARKLLAEYEHGENLVMAHAHLLHQTLKVLRDVLNELPDDAAIDGVDRPVTVSALLGQFGTDIASHGDE